MHTWSAEERVDEARAAELVRTQFPQLAARAVELVSEGWDYVVYRVDDAWAFRFPRREVVVPGTEREIRCMPLLAPLLPVGVPVPTYVGRSRWPFYGAPYLPGREAAQADAPAIAADLGRTLRALHDVRLDLDLPADPLRRVDMPFRLAQLRERGITGLEEAETLPPAEHTAICHGDLHVRQLLVDGRRLSGIVDWVDLCRSDPAVDLSIAWSLLDADARAAFFAEYGEIDRARELRARVVAAFLSALLVDWAREQHVPDVLETASAGLRRAVAG